MRLPPESLSLNRVEPYLEQPHAAVIEAPEVGDEIANVEDPLIEISLAVGGNFHGAI